MMAGMSRYFCHDHPDARPGAVVLEQSPLHPGGGGQLAFRTAQTELHTGAHVLNALVYQQFNGALLTGAQLGDDGTARYAWMPRAEAEAQAGLLRSRSVAPPPSPDGTIRIVEIVGLDRHGGPNR